MVVEAPHARKRVAAVCLALSLQWHALPAAAAADGTARTLPDAAGTTPARGLGAADLALVVNSDDPLSVAIGNYYIARRAIPKANVAKVSFDYRRDELSMTQFTAVRAAVLQQLGPRVQLYALTWARPYRVGCMSITSAFTFGADERYCAGGCSPTKSSPYFNASTARPYDDLGMRPTMSIAAADFAHAKALIDRGVRADGLQPRGTAYLVMTPDQQRNVREMEYPLAVRVAQHEFNFHVFRGAPPAGRGDVMFYFTGASQVGGVDGSRFLPGAVADHLTSYGGMLTDSPQMSSLRWLEAGATGSFGTVVEPCNLAGKFPDVPVLLAHYLGGDTLIEAYWKSVLMPGQGIFIGEPLAAPFRAPAPPQRHLAGGP